MRHLLRKMVISISIILMSFAFSILAFASGTKYVYNGNTSSGWGAAGGAMNLLSGYGYDGSMYWQTTATANSQDTTGYWYTGSAISSSTGYYVYIPSGSHATATVDYGCSYTGGWADIIVNQTNYSNVWVYLGTHATDSSSNGIVGSWGDATGGSYVGWDEVKFTY